MDYSCSLVSEQQSLLTINQGASVKAASNINIGPSGQLTLNGILNLHGSLTIATSGNITFAADSVLSTFAPITVGQMATLSVSGLKLTLLGGITIEGYSRLVMIGGSPGFTSCYLYNPIQIPTDRPLLITTQAFAQAVGFKCS